MSNTKSKPFIVCCTKEDVKAISKLTKVYIPKEVRTAKCSFCAEEVLITKDNDEKEKKGEVILICGNCALMYQVLTGRIQEIRQPDNYEQKLREWRQEELERN